MPVFKAGAHVGEREEISASRARTLNSLAVLADEYRRFDAPRRYPVGLESGLSGLKRELVTSLRAKLY